MRRRQRTPEGRDDRGTSSSRISATHRRFVQALLYVHLGSLLACAAALHAQDSETSAADGDDVESSQHSTPTLDFFRPRPARSLEMSYPWRNNSPHDICYEAVGVARTAALNATYLLDQPSPISLWEVFTASTKALSSGRKSMLNLKPGVEGSDCVNGSYVDCMRCFSRVTHSFERLSAAYANFESTLRRFDCMEAVDTDSATRPFSPNGSCDQCKTWYGRWLLVHLTEIWLSPPCINWCYYAQLACPHLATSKVVDYAGHPSFQCRDMHITIGDAGDAHSCKCVHPCDVRGTVSSLNAKSEGNLNSQNDFFAASEHCDSRRKHCEVFLRKSPSRSSSSGDLQVSAALLTLSIVLVGLFFGVLPSRP